MNDELVIIGAGSAGAVIAARVTEDPQKRVLLIEAGPDYDEPAKLPEDLVNGNRNSLKAHDWGLTFRPASWLAETYYPRGKVMGGSSAVNTAIALRGEPEDYDEWGALGCASWSWDQCLPAFKRLESDLDFEGERAIHGHEGPIPIARAQGDELVPFQRAFVEAARTRGFAPCPDHNAPAALGVGPLPMNKRGRVRVSTAMAYLDPATRKRPNLRIMPRTLAHRVVVEGGRVTGVVVEREGRVETIPCRRVVLSAGAILTPPILIRSGIGPRDLLDRLGVPVSSELPGVGARLWDHPGSMIALIPKEGVASWDHPMVQTLLRYSSGEGAPRADMQIEPFSFIQIGPGAPLLVGMASVVEKPFAHGRLVIESRDPHALPRSETNFLADERDLERLVSGIEIVLELAHSSVIKELISDFALVRSSALTTREAIRGWVRYACGSGLHPAGTAPMGPRDDPASVVDTHGRVYGVDGLFVADASIMPTIPRANTNLPTIMIGERFGAWLREDLT